MTEYKIIFDAFKDKVSDYDLPHFDELIQDDILNSLLDKACSKFSHSCKYDLNDKNAEMQYFNCTLDYEDIDILSEWMVNEWLYPFLNNSENLRNRLSTKDFTSISPANLLSAIQSVHTTSRKRARSIMNEYSFINSDMEKLKT